MLWVFLILGVEYNSLANSYRWDVERNDFVLIGIMELPLSDALYVEHSSCHLVPKERTALTGPQWWICTLLVMQPQQHLSKPERCAVGVNGWSEIGAEPFQTEKKLNQLHFSPLCCYWLERSSQLRKTLLFVT